MRILVMGNEDIPHPVFGTAVANLSSAYTISERGHEVIYVPSGKLLPSKVELAPHLETFIPITHSKSILKPLVSRLSPSVIRIFSTANVSTILGMKGAGYDRDFLDDLRREWRPDLVLHEGPGGAKEPLRLHALGIPLVERMHWLGAPFYIKNIDAWEGFSGFKLKSFLGSIASKPVGFAVKSLVRKVALSADEVITLLEINRRMLESYGVKANTIFPAYKLPTEPMLSDAESKRRPPDILIPGSSYFSQHIEVRFAMKLASKLPHLKFAFSGIRNAPEGCPPNLEIGFFDAMTYLYYIKMARLVVIPLLHADGFPMKLAEALAYGKPVLTSSIALDVIPNLRPWREIAVEDDPWKYAKIIKYLLEDENTLKNLSSGARAYYLSSTINPELHGKVLSRLLERYA